MKALGKMKVHAVFFIALVLLAGQSLAQSPDGDIFSNTDALMQTANDAGAELLSPKYYASAQKHYAKAKDYESRGRTDKARDKLADVQKELKKAIAASDLGKVNFASTLKSRDWALAAEAPKYEPGLWAKAEEQFERAARALESGNVNSATDRGLKANTYYNDAELAAIKTGIVGTARILIFSADEDRVGREAPITLDKAKALVAQAEADLDKSRYKTEKPIALAAVAEYEARHASYIASQVRRVDDDELTIEGLILNWEKPVQNIATALDVTTDMTDGYSKSSEASVAMASTLVAEHAQLSSQVASLQARLGGNEAIVKETKRLQQQLNRVESLFTAEEARVVREGSDLLLRLVGLSFPSGQSVIETRYFGLLKKVQKAIEVYPDSAIVIEGHTDSVGSDAVNMKLSQDRANSVREYLIANLGLPESRVSAVGFGKNKPIASNETEFGRAQNRRIDAVIRNARARR